MSDGPNFLDQQEWAALDPSRPLPPPLTDDERALALARIRADRLARTRGRGLTPTVAEACACAAHAAGRPCMLCADGGRCYCDCAEVLPERTAMPFTAAQEESFAATRALMAKRKRLPRRPA